MRLLLWVVSISKKKCALVKESILTPSHCTAHFSCNTWYQRMINANVGDTVFVPESVIQGHHIYKEMWTPRVEVYKSQETSMIVKLFAC